MFNAICLTKRRGSLDESGSIQAGQLAKNSMQVDKSSPRKGKEQLSQRSHQPLEVLPCETLTKLD